MPQPICMPVQKTFGLLALLAIQACAPEAAQISTTQPTAEQTASPLEILPGASAVIPSLGTGWSTLAEDYMGRCVSGATRRLSVFDAASTLRITNNLNAEKAQQTMGFGAGARAHFGLGSAGFKAQAAAALTQDAFSSVWVFAANYVSEAEELDFDQDTHMTVIGRHAQKRQWQQECGDEFVYQIQKGAQLYLIYRLDYQSESLKNTVSHHLGGQASVLEVNAALRSLQQQLSRHAQLTIEVFQFGGDPQKITGIITGPGASHSQAEQAARAVIRCGIDDFDACEQFLTNALVYATRLHQADGFPEQIGAAPSPILYVTMPWTRLGQDVTHSPDSYQVAEARLSLSALFDQVHLAKKRVELLLETQWSDAAQRSELEPWIGRLGFALGQIHNAVGLCYDALRLDPQRQQMFSAATVARCEDAVRHLQRVIVLPRREDLRGPVERALSARYAADAGRRGQPAKADDPVAHATPTGAALCATLPSGDALCGYEGALSAQQCPLTFAVPQRLWAAWNALPESLARQHAQRPTTEACQDGNVTYMDFAPDAALFDNGFAPPRLLYGDLLAHYRTYAGPSRLGLPSAHQGRAPDDLGTVAKLTHATLYCRDAGRCHELQPSVYAAWQAVGGALSCLGFPKEGRASGTFTCFEGGSLHIDPEGVQAPQVQCPARWGRCG
jgi:hypothetical protein